MFDRQNNFVLRNPRIHYRVYRIIAYSRETQAGLSYRVHIFLSLRNVLL